MALDIRLTNDNGPMVFLFVLAFFLIAPYDYAATLGNQALVKRLSPKSLQESEEFVLTYTLYGIVLLLLLVASVTFYACFFRRYKSLNVASELARLDNQGRVDQAYQDVSSMQGAVCVRAAGREGKVLTKQALGVMRDQVRLDQLQWDKYGRLSFITLSILFGASALVYFAIAAVASWDARSRSGSPDLE